MAIGTGTDQRTVAKMQLSCKNEDLVVEAARCMSRASRYRGRRIEARECP
jgi:hypothetical protein